VTDGTALLERKQLLGPEALVVQLAGRLDQVLEMRPGQEVPEVDEFAVVLILDVDHTPAVLATPNSTAVNRDGLLTSDDGKRNHRLDLRVDGGLFVVIVLVVVWVHPDVVESKLLPDPVLECLSLLQSQAVRLGDNRNNVDAFTEFLENDNVDWLQSMASGVNEVQAAVNSGVLDVAFSLRSKLLAQVGRVLVLDVFDDGVPATVIVNEITEARSINNVQAQTDAILFNDVSDGVDLGRAANRLGRRQTSFGIYEMGCEDGVDEGRFSEPGLTCSAISVISS